MSAVSSVQMMSVLAIALTVTGCAYQTYMAEERSRTNGLNTELSSEQAKTPALQRRAQNLEERKAQLSRDLEGLKRKLAAHQAALARIPTSSTSRSPDPPADVISLQKEIANTNKRIANKEQELLILTAY